MEETTIEFDILHNPAKIDRHKMVILHNLNTHGLSIISAFYAWVDRTKVYTAKDFTQYVQSKNPGILVALVKSYLVYNIKDN